MGERAGSYIHLCGNIKIYINLYITEKIGEWGSSVGEGWWPWGLGGPGGGGLGGPGVSRWPWGVSWALLLKGE